MNESTVLERLRDCEDTPHYLPDGLLADAIAEIRALREALHTIGFYTGWCTKNTLTFIARTALAKSDTEAEVPNQPKEYYHEQASKSHRRSP